MMAELMMLCYGQQYENSSKGSFDERENADPKEKKSLCTLVNF